MPEPSSVQLNDTVTSVLFQPAPFAAGVCAPTIVGALVSMRTTIEVVALLPAGSLREPATVATPSAVTCTLSGHAPVAKPDSASVHVKCTVTGPLFQPFAFGSVSSDALIVGAVWSMLIPETVVDAGLPAASVAEPLAD